MSAEQVVDTAVESKPLAEQAYDRLFEAIRECELMPGTRVSERSLAADLGLGLAPVRAALAKLAANRVLVAIPRVGYEVRSFTGADVDDFFDAWRLLAPRLVEEAMRQGGDELASHMSRVVSSAKAEAAAMSLDAGWVHVAETTFDALVDRLDNPYLTRFYRILRFDMHRLFTLALRGEGDSLDRVFSDDDYSWMTSGDPVGARHAVEQFLEGAHPLIRTRVIEVIRADV